MSDLRLASEHVIVQAPMSYRGATRRLWRLSGPGRRLINDRQPDTNAVEVALRWTLGVTLITAVCVLIVVGWVVVTVWYALFGLLLVPYRLIRRGQRRDRKRELQHRELLARMEPRDRP